MTVYRAAYLKGAGGATVLTGREHSHFSFEHLRHEALKEALRGDIIDMKAESAEQAHPRITIDDFWARLVVGEWRE